MELGRRVVAIVGIAVAAACFGCGKTEQPPESISAKTSGPLPEWAPENPSPEFLRAAKVLKPLPAEIILTARDPLERVTQQVAWQEHILPRTWEVFGTLSEDQVEHFLTARTVFVKVAEMTAEQRGALERLLRDFKNLEVAGQSFDLQVHLYKLGAREDFSNVEVGFALSQGGDFSKAVMFLATVRGRNVGDPHGTYGMGTIAHM